MHIHLKQQQQQQRKHNILRIPLTGKPTKFWTRRILNRPSQAAGLLGAVLLFDAATCVP
jgi:hypothetical protein